MTDYIPNTDKERAQMLKAIGIENTHELFKDIPKKHLLKKLLNIPEPLSEMELGKYMAQLSDKNKLPKLSFIGGGSYNHFIPSTVDHIIRRSEFFTAYTPYQPEISQGSLQAIYEFQTMIADLSGMDLANASMYDGSTSLAESATLVCLHKRRGTILLSKAVHPEYRRVVRTYVRARNFNVIEINIKDGETDANDLKEKNDEDVAGVLIQSPNFFGVIEDQKKIARIAHKNNSLMVTCVTEGISLGFLKSPGELGADAFVGEGQSFGIPVSFGGPYIGLFAVKREFMRRIPGRLTGKTVDAEGKEAYILTLQAREQHIRRERASSNICTNQGLLAIANATYLSTVGKKLKDIAYLNMQKARYAYKTLPGRKVFQKDFFNEFVLRIKNAKKAHRKLSARGIVAGLCIEDYYPEYKDCILFCVTELNTKEDIDLLAKELRAVQ